MHNKEILELFPTPVYATKMPVELSTVIPFLDKQSMDTDTDEQNYGRRSKDSYILNKPECRNLKNYILECVHEYATETLMYDYTQYRLSQSWISHKEPGQHHTLHTHPNSLISGCLYYGPSQEATPALVFHKLAGAINASFISPKIKPDRRNAKFAWTEFAINFEPGLLVLFPSYVLHSVPVNQTDSVRCSLAFNIVPTVGFGEETSLTELLF
jgi:uncharacterized protein (TIGR02466 family)